jgi:hypothetical protein
LKKEVQLKIIKENNYKMKVSTLMLKGSGYKQISLYIHLIQVEFHREEEVKEGWISREDEVFW